jgi:hypothetical protein
LLTCVRLLPASATAGVAMFVKVYPQGLTAEEIGQIIAAMVAAGLIVYGVPNKGQNTEV